MAEPSVDPALEDLEIDLLLEALYRRYQHDFRAYSRASLQRRVDTARRRLKCDTVSQLQDRILRDPADCAALVQALTVQVSEMFRDPAFFRTVRDQVVPVLRTYPSVRLWVAGCSTGEEVLSFAILLEEEGLLDRTTMYATDINTESLRRAEAGVYPIAAVAGFSANYIEAGGRASLAEYYVAEYGHAVFSRRLRSRTVYADHSLATDHVFAEVQMVTCRNVLIYFGRDLQDRAIGLFREALCPGGFLGLGSRESLAFSRHADAFADVSRDHRIYRRR
jgi:chemotaxis protein methyltransferase CheR